MVVVMVVVCVCLEVGGEWQGWRMCMLQVYEVVSGRDMGACGCCTVRVVASFICPLCRLTGRKLLGVGGID